ncbi:sulfite exporter TauE/SafE family protein [uncultured Flavobacterium sp.]|uniref:sulfite exporter TauE/SafE family protein n=1 Tax=uncultured Flavobacterium sp. TaxID=165435 RepID=UPI0025FBE50C|nr:sulfite exporter TauE/SafE family protein [uncultured Flavobacterium sp.]
MLLSALLLGLVSSLHCIGMCGPIAMMLPVDRNNQARQTLQLLLYHLGRISAYASLGLIFGILGRGFYLAGMQQEFSVVAGFLMILIAMLPEKTLAKYNFSVPVYRIISNIKTALGSQFRKRGYKAFFMTGLLNGYLPCGLVYAALFGAIAMQGAGFGMLYMMLYGAGTIPLMSLVIYSAGFIKNSMRAAFSKIVSYMVACVGMLFILRGLGLGIPYVSPSNISLHVTEAPDCK